MIGRTCTAIRIEQVAEAVLLLTGYQDRNRSGITYGPRPTMVNFGQWGVERECFISIEREDGRTLNKLSETALNWVV